MSFKDLRQFIEFLEAKGELVKISTSVTWDLEITEICDRVVKNGGPALLFTNVEGYTTPVLINMFGSSQRMAWALGLNDLNEIQGKVEAILSLAQGGPPKGIINKMKTLGELAKISSFRPKTVTNAPCQEVIVKGEAVNLYDFPILKCWPGDAGRYITLPLVITKDPVTGRQNMGMYRIQVFDHNTTGMHWQTQKVGTQHYRLAKQHGATQIDVAVAIGGDPATIWSGSAPLPPDIDEVIAAGFIRGQSVEMVKAKTVDLMVPAEAELILEGQITLGEHRTEGPFGDHTGYYSLPDTYPVFHVKCITHRKNPIYPTIVVGKPPMEDYFMGKVTERMFLPIIQMVIPEIIDINMPAEGVFHNLVIISVKKDYPGQARKAIYGLLGLGLMSLAKAIIAVDHTVDIQDLSEVTWRVTNNIDAERDIFFLHGPVDDLDHASARPKFGSKVGIDATSKLQEEGFSREWPPDIVMSRNITDLVDKKWTEYGI